MLQIIPELERSADLAEHIAQRTIGHVGGLITPRSRGLIQSMSDIAVDMWKVAGTAYRQRSRDAGFRLSDADNELDDLATSLVNEGVAEGTEPQVAVDLALIARYYERLGDHAVNLARRVDTMAAPRRLAAPAVLDRRKDDVPATPDPKRRGLRRFLHPIGNFRLAPTDDGFFDLFRAAGNNARECAIAVNKLVTSSDLIDEHFEEVRGFERTRRRAHRRPAPAPGRELRHAVRPRGHPRAGRRARRRRRRHVRGGVAAPALRRRASVRRSSRSWPRCW